MADTFSHSQLEAFLLTVAVTAAAGDSHSPQTGKSPRKADQLSEAETEPPPDADIADSTVSSDIEAEDVDLGGWREIGSRMASVLSYSDDTYPYKGIVGLKARQITRSAPQVNALDSDVDVAGKEEAHHEYEEEVIDVNKWRMVGKRVLSAFDAAREDDEEDQDIVDINKWQVVGSLVLSALAAADVQN